MTATTLSTSISAGITLAPGGSFASPFTVTSTGTINSTGGIGIVSSLSATIDNLGVIIGDPAGIFLTAGGVISNGGLIEGNGTLFTFGGHSYVASGIAMLGGGTVVNLAAGKIESSEIAIGNTHSTAAVLTIENSGLIETTGTTAEVFQGTTFLPIAVDLAAGGDVINHTGAIIRGDEVGILIEAPGGGHAVIANYGTITASGTALPGVTGYPNAVSLLDGGTLTNASKGLISSDSGVFISTGTSAAAASVSNAGTIKGLRDAIIGTSASIINVKGGLLTATDDGVLLVGAGSVTNAGSISATGVTFVTPGGVTYDAIGVFAAPASAIDNESGGHISSGAIGVYGNKITNAGVITGSFYGVISEGGGTLSNAAGASITGGFGVFAIGALGVTNAGTITGTTGPALEIYLPGATTLTNSGLLKGVEGVAVYTAATSTSTSTLALTNTGTIIATDSAIGIFESFTAAGEGVVTNGGVVSSTALTATNGGTTYTVTAVQLENGATLVNEAAGRITAPGFAVAAFSGTGSFFVNNAGTITGGTGGIATSNTEIGTILNTGTITSSAGSAIGLNAGGAVTNATGGVISGANGIEDYGASVFLLNQGSIDVTKYAFDQFNSLTGTVTLDNTGTIITADEAIALYETFTTAGAGLVENSGLIQQTATLEVNNGTTYTPTAVQVESGGTFINTGTVEAAGIAAGAFSGTGSFFINNSGVISGAANGISSSDTEIGTILNSGTITSSLNNAIGLNGGGVVTNATAGVVSGAGGIFDNNAASVFLLNQGNITVTRSALDVYDSLTGTATLDNAGTIVTADEAVVLAENFTVKGAGLVENAGLIEQTATLEVNNGSTYAPTAVVIQSGATLINTGTIQAAGSGAGDYSPGAGAVFENSGLIAADQTGIGTGTAAIATVINSGTIVNQGTGSAIYFADGGTINNSGSIISEGTGAAIYLPDGGTIIDSGLIAGTGSGGSAINSGTAAITLTLQTGAFISGGVNLGGTIGNVLDFASLSHGAINLGGSINGFDTFDFAKSATWALSGTVAELAAGQTIAGFAKTDQIVLEDFTATSHSFGTHGLVLNGTTTLDIKGSFPTSSFTLTDSGGNTTIALATAGAASPLTGQEAAAALPELRANAAPATSGWPATAVERGAWTTTPLAATQDAPTHSAALGALLGDAAHIHLYLPVTPIT